MPIYGRKQPFTKPIIKPIINPPKPSGNTTPPDLGSLGTYAPTVSTGTNVFTKFPPIIPMAFIAVTLIAMAQFGSTEKLAAAFAWLVFVAVLLADGTGAFDKITSYSKTK